MVIKSGELEGSIFSSLMAWSTAGLGIDVPCSLKLLVGYCHRKVGAFAQGENENSINELPDDILCNIVSRLNSIEASRTSIMSRRWNKIWTLNSVITFSCLGTLDIMKNYHDHVGGDKQRFFKAVDQCLQLYSGQKLKAFCVHCCFLKGNECHLVRWIQIIARLDIEKLSLGHSCSFKYGQPPAFTFSFKLIDKLSKLKTLDLMFSYVETSFVSQCNSLVNLYLTGVAWRRHGLSDILVSFPNLEILSITSCTLPRNLKFPGPNLKLKILKLYDCFALEKLEISELNLLQVIKIKTCNKVEIMLSSVPKLHTLDLVTPGMDNYFVDVQGDLPQLNYLLIQTTFKILSLPSTFRVFSNVRRLCLMTRGYPWYWKKTNGEVDLWNFASVLSACPLLERLYLSVRQFRKEERNAAAWPVLRHKHLEYMELAGFSNTQYELEFAKFILTSAEVTPFTCTSGTD